MNTIKRHPKAALLAVFVLVGVIAAATSSSSPNHQAVTSAKVLKPRMTANEKSARDYVSNLGLDARRVQASIDTVEVAVGELQQSKTEANVEQVAQAAQGAHDELNSIRQDFAADAPDASGQLQNSEAQVWQAANDLKNSMGSLVTLAGNPNPATEARFSTQYAQARAEWDAGVRAVWQVAREGGAPTV